MLLAIVSGLALAAVVSLALVLSVTALGAEPSRTATFVLLGSAAYLCLSLTAWWFCLRRHRAPWASMGFTKPGLAVMVGMAPLSIGLLIANGALVLLTSAVVGGLENPQGEELAPGGVLSSESFVLLFLLVAIIAPVGEELVFRGMLYRYLRSRRSVLPAVILSAALFSLAHVVPVLLLPLFVLGVALAIVTERSASIYPAIALHALNNGISLALLYAASSRA